MFSLNIDPLNPKGNPEPAELKELGVEMVRYTFYDSSGGDNIDPGRADFYKQKAQAYGDAGIGSLVILTYDTYPNKPPFDGDWNDYINRFANRSRQIAELLAPWQPAFQIWNEADHDRKNVGTPYDPCVRSEPFGQMLRRTHDAVKSVNPAFKTVVGGLASGNHTWLTKVIKSQGGQLPADIVAFHPYGQRPEPNWPSPNWAFGYFGDLLNNYYQAGRRKTVWITEMGIKEQDVGDNREQAAEFLRRYYKTITTKYANSVEQLFWFCYSDGMVPTFGLKDANQTPKPIYSAFRQAVDAKPAAPPPPPPKPKPVAPPPPPPAPAPPAAPAPEVVAEITKPLQQEIATLKTEKTNVQEQVQQSQQKVGELEGQLQQLLAQRDQLQAQLEQAQTQVAVAPAPAAAGGPPIRNIVQRLKHHPTKRFPERSGNQIQRVVVHHTGIPATIGADRIAAHRVDKQDWPGIGYHFFITGDGQIQQTNELITLTAHAGQFNAVSVAVCFAGDFNQAVPPDIQINAGGQLIGWLLKQLNLSLDAVSGLKELIPGQPGPGAQWDAGANWRESLKERIQANL